MPGSQPEDIQTIRFPFVGESLSRSFSSAKDQRFVNCYFDTLENSITQKKFYFFVKRPGLTLAINAAGGAATARGSYSWNGNLYSCYGNKVYKGTTQLGVTLATSTGRVTFEGTRPTSGLSPVLALNDGVSLYVISADDSITILNNVVISSSSIANPSVITTATAHGLTTGNKVVIRGHSGSVPSINDTLYTVTVINSTSFSIPVNVTTGGTGGTIGVFPSPNNSQLVYFDGMLYVLGNNGAIYNSDLDDARTWNPANFIVPIMDHSSPVGITRQSNYIVCFFEDFTQGFYNAANATGSPLANYEQAMLQIGCAAKDSIANEEAFVTWVGQNETGGFTVYKLDGIAQYTDIGDPTIRRVLENERSNLNQAAGHLIRFSGHVFYILYLPSANRTFLYDYDLKVWIEWESTSGTGFPIYNYGQHNERAYAQHLTNGKIYYLDPSVGTDDGVNFNCYGITSNIDMETNDRKFVYSLEVIGDVQSSSTPVSISYSDDDYNTWSTARTIDMSYNRNLLKQLGNFRRRALKISYTGPNPLRIQWFQIKYRLGIN